jgi:hypothetical protein
MAIPELGAPRDWGRSTVTTDRGNWETRKGFQLHVCFVRRWGEVPEQSAGPVSASVASCRQDRPETEDR